jgi:carboxyl-terminal processing protease
MNSRLKFFVVTGSTILALLLLMGSVLGQSTSTDDTLKHIGVFTDVVSRIKTEYVEEPDMKSVTLGALSGMLAAVDPFASYLNADQYRDYLKNKDVKRADVGLILSKAFDYVRVVGVVPGSPAAKAGFTTGDMIESIKDIATRDMPLAYADLLLRGDAGTSIELSVVRVTKPEPTNVTLTRVNLTLPPVEDQMLAGQVAYIKPSALSAARVKETAAEIEKAQKDGAQKLIIDLRNTALGDPEDGIAFANLFLNKGLITYLQGQRIPRQNFNADASKAITTLPTVILTNRGTADAAEIAAAALMGNNRAELVGEPTYGEASMRKAITMDDGSAIILSVAKYYSPDGKSIQDNRVTPKSPNQILQAEPQVDVDDNGEPLVENNNDQQPQQQKKLEEDPMVKKALDILGTRA